MKILKYFSVSLFCLFALNLYSQIPTDVPNPQNNTPVDFSKPANIIILIVLPVVIVIFTIIWYNKKRKDKELQK